MSQNKRSEIAPAEGLRQAAANIATYGWCRHTAQNREGELCAIGALSRAMYGLAGYTEALSALGQVMAEQLDYEGSPTHVADMNDNFIHDAQELIACMEKAAAKLEETS